MIAIRPATSADGPLIQALVRGLTPKSRYLRFFNGVQELSPSWLERFSTADVRGNFTVLAVARDQGVEVAAGMAQYSALAFPRRCEFAVVVTDACQRRGIGARLIRHLVGVARAAGLERIEGDVLAENQSMLRVLRGLGFHVARDPDSALHYRASLALISAATHRASGEAATQWPATKMLSRLPTSSLGSPPLSSPE